MRDNMAVVGLTFRQLTKEDSHFLVKYHEDGELQVRSRGFVLTQDKVMRLFFHYPIPPYQLDESISKFRGVWCILCHFYSILNRNSFKQTM